MYRHGFTRLGFHFLFVALFAIVGGSLRGFNLLLVLAGLLVAVVLVQWRQGRASIRRIRLKREQVSWTFEGLPVDIDYTIRNTAWWLPVWSVRIEDRVTAETIGMPARQADRQDSDQPISLIGSIGYVPARQSRGTSIVCRFNHRGLYSLGPLVTSTSFPFCLMNSQHLDANCKSDFYVYPKPLPLKSGWERLLPPRLLGDSRRSGGGSSYDGEFFGLRPWQSGDHVKHVHWRTTARIGTPAVRQFEQRHRHQVCVLADCTLRNGSDLAEEEIEWVLRLATTILTQVANQTRSVALLVADQQSANPDDHTEIIHSIGNDLRPVLERLAVVEPVSVSSDSADPIDLTLPGVKNQLQRYDLVVVSSRGFDSLPHPQTVSDDESAASTLRHFRQLGRLSWLDVRSPRVRHWVHLDEAPTANSQERGHHAVR